MEFLPYPTAARLELLPGQAGGLMVVTGSSLLTSSGPRVPLARPLPLRAKHRPTSASHHNSFLGRGGRNRPKSSTPPSNKVGLVPATGGIVGSTTCPNTMPLHVCTTPILPPPTGPNALPSGMVSTAGPRRTAAHLGNLNLPIPAGQTPAGLHHLPAGLLSPGANSAAASSSGGSPSGRLLAPITASRTMLSSHQLLHAHASAYTHSHAHSHCHCHQLIHACLHAAGMSGLSAGTGQMATAEETAYPDSDSVPGLVTTCGDQLASQFGLLRGKTLLPAADLPGQTHNQVPIGTGSMGNTRPSCAKCPFEYSTQSKKR
ncbi:unnamed protein product [Protopolystoma xenopodis]|uniref:Uncharacterized protein n=1 Tax=Protopolystoma xenopodis TaxID=117903 RepID=A0A3S5ACG5_9PLAT|nr:unnamed protein product [Protopolystoma xenopodis]